MFSKTPFDAPDVALMQALKFSSKDLDANRDGLLTADQKRRIWRWQLGWSVLMWSIALFVAWLGQSGPSMWHIEAIRVLWVSLVVVLILVAFWLQQRVTRVLAAGKVVRAYGPMKRRMWKGERSDPAYYIRICEEEFEVSQNIYNFFCDGENYTLYYLPVIHYLLSVDHHPRPEEPRKPSTKRSGKGH